MLNIGCDTNGGDGKVEMEWAIEERGKAVFRVKRSRRRIDRIELDKVTFARDGRRFEFHVAALRTASR